MDRSESAVMAMATVMARVARGGAIPSDQVLTWKTPRERNNYGETPTETGPLCACSSIVACSWCADRGRAKRASQDKGQDGRLVVGDRSKKRVHGTWHMWVGLLLLSFCCR